MITRERNARKAAERQLAEARAQAAEDRAQAAKERAQAAEERKQFIAIIQQLVDRLFGPNQPGSQRQPKP